MADRSDFGWSVVSIYENDEFADNSDNEKKLMKAEKEAERLRAKKRKASTAAGARKRAASFTEIPTKVAGNIPVGGRQPPARMRPLGLCFCCGKFGNLAVSCSKSRPMHPFDQPVAQEAVDTCMCVLSQGANELVHNCMVAQAPLSRSVNDEIKPVLSGSTATSAVPVGMDRFTTSPVVNMQQSTVYTYSPTSQYVEGVSTAENHDNSDLVGWSKLSDNNLCKKDPGNWRDQT